MIKNPMTLLILTLLHFSLSQLVVSQELEIVSPASVGFSDSGLELATAALQQHIDNGDIAGVVAAVARDGKLIYFEALGQIDLEQGKPMRDDALFRLYSMTRQITSAAVLQLYEQGKFRLDDPIKMIKRLFEFNFGNQLCRTSALIDIFTCHVHVCF